MMRASAYALAVLLVLMSSAASAADSGVDALIAAVKQGCLHSIESGTPITSFIKQQQGGLMPPAVATMFLQGNQGTVYGIPHPDHHFAIASTHKGNACSVFVRRIDTAAALPRMEALLLEAGYIHTEPPTQKNGLTSTVFSKTAQAQRFQVIVSYSPSVGKAAFQWVTTVFNVGPGGDANP